MTKPLPDHRRANFNGKAQPRLLPLKRARPAQRYPTGPRCVSADTELANNRGQNPARMADLGPVAWPPELIRTERLVLREPEARDRAAFI